MKIAAGADHGGFALKQAVVRRLRSLGHEVIDVGTDSEEVSVDYPVYGHKVAELVASGEVERGVLVCGTGIGICMSANRHKGVRAADCFTPYHAEITRRHNDCNVLCLGGPPPERGRGVGDHRGLARDAVRGRPSRAARRAPRRRGVCLSPVGREWRREPLYHLDPELNELLRSELIRQQETLELIASENFASRAVLEATGSVLTNKYAEGLPGARYYGGCDVVDQVEQLAIDRCKEVFGAEHANVQPHSGSSANLAALFALLEPGDTMLAMELAHGGHLTHGLGINYSGRTYNVVPYHVRPDTEIIDYDEVRALALEHRPKLIICGYSSYPRIIDFAAFREIADECGALLMADIAHIAGLIAAGVHPNPVPYCDVVTSTTHKTLTGPRAGIIMCRKEYAEAIDRAVFPGMQGGPLMHVIAAKAVCLRIAQSDEFHKLQRQIVKNCAVLAETLAEGGLRLVSGGTDVHLALVDLRRAGLNGLECQDLLERVNITANRNVVPFEDASFNVASGLRVGSPAVSTRGFMEPEMRQTGELMLRAIANRDNDAALAEIRHEVLDLLDRFPLYEFL